MGGFVALHLAFKYFLGGLYVKTYEINKTGDVFLYRIINFAIIWCLCIGRYIRVENCHIM